MKVEKWTGNEAVSVNGILDLLNATCKLDPEFMQTLITSRFPCNENIKDHPSIQVHCYKDASEEKPKAGFLGVLNGLIGVDVNVSGPVAANFNEEGQLQGFSLTDTESVSARIREQTEGGA